MVRVLFKTDDKELYPYRKHEEDAGWDLRAAEEYNIAYKEKVTIDTGIKVLIPDGYVGLIVPRSSTGSNGGLVLRNTIGVIDAHYTGPILCKVTNVNEKPLLIKKYERFAQILIIPIHISQFIAVDELPNTHRGESGFGDTGKI